MKGGLTPLLEKKDDSLVWLQSKIQQYACIYEV